MTDSLQIVANFQQSNMTSSWTEYLCLHQTPECNWCLDIRVFEMLGEESEYCNEKGELPEQIDGYDVIGTEDGYVVINNLVVHSEDYYPTYKFEQFDDHEFDALFSPENSEWCDDETKQAIRNAIMNAKSSTEREPVKNLTPKQYAEHLLGESISENEKPASKPMTEREAMARVSALAKRLAGEETEEDGIRAEALRRSKVLRLVQAGQIRTSSQQKVSDNQAQQERLLISGVSHKEFLTAAHKLRSEMMVKENEDTRLEEAAGIREGARRRLRARSLSGGTKARSKTQSEMRLVHRLLDELSSHVENKTAFSGADFPIDTLLGDEEILEWSATNFMNGHLVNIYGVKESNQTVAYISSDHSDGGVVVRYGGPWKSLEDAKRAFGPAEEDWTDV